MARPSTKPLRGGRGFALARRLPQTRCIGAEIGVWDGQLAEYLLKSLPRLTLIMVDRWAVCAPDSSYGMSGSEIANSSEDSFAAALAITRRRTAFADLRRRFIQGESVEVAKVIEDASLDFVFVDADHTEAAVKADLHAWYPKVRPGGLVAGHDWAHPNERWGVSAAVKKFRTEHKITTELELDDDRTWFWRKPDGGLSA